ncbi:Hypothetical protein HVR_LOCUS522 [uncultured virus]|nr:Hypothetical protein HVR_LOCUS522 [uncultured virus]
MDNYLPADSRARVTLDQLLTPLINAINNSISIRNITQALVDRLPPGISYQSELRMRMMRGLVMNDILKTRVLDIVRHVILMRIGEELPSITDTEGNKIYYYMREDVIRWYRQISDDNQYFQAPLQELVTIQIRYGEIVKQSVMPLSEDQMVGIAYGLNSMKERVNVTLISSITNETVNVDDIAKHALIYRLPINLATEELKRPYRVDVLEPEGNFRTLHFANPEFMQGILSVAQWFRLPNNGRDIMWKNLFQFTRETLVPLEF